jgi:hypothetical protein
MQLAQCGNPEGDGFYVCRNVWAVIKSLLLVIFVFIGTILTALAPTDPTSLRDTIMHPFIKFVGVPIL